MRLINFWLLKSKEKQLIKIIEWAQKNNIKVENLSEKDIKEALKDRI